MRSKILFTLLSCILFSFHCSGQKHFVGLSLEFQKLDNIDYYTPTHGFDFLKVEESKRNHVNFVYNYRTTHLNHRLQVNIPVSNNRKETITPLYGIVPNGVNVRSVETTLHFIGQYTLSKKLESKHSIFYFGVFCQPNYLIHTISPKVENLSPSIFKRIEMLYGPSLGFELKLSKITSIGLNFNLSVLQHSKYFYEYYDPDFNKKIAYDYYGYVNLYQLGLSVNHSIVSL